MGASCQPTEDKANASVCDDEKTHLRDRDSYNMDRVHQQHDIHATQEFNEMQNQVILLSTTNANLEQRLDETREELLELKQNTNDFLENDIALDLLKLCKDLKVDYIKTLMAQIGPVNTDSKVDILKDFLDIDVDDKIKSKYLNAFNSNAALYALIEHLRHQNKMTVVSRIVIMLTFKSYYRKNKGSENDGDFKKLKVFCNALDESTETVNKIQQKAKQEIIAQSIDIFSL